MAQVASLTPDSALATAPVIDRGHLERMTFGDSSLEREVLQLFDRQAAILVARMRVSEPAAVATLAHTLKGSASGIGAVYVVQAAEAAEIAAGRSRAETGAALDGLAKAVDEARALIATLLHTH